jgi:hypothetical protein
MGTTPLPQLLVPIEQAAEKIKEQINRGHQVTDVLRLEGKGLGFAEAAAFRAATIDAEKWAKFTIDLLKGLFADFSVGREFGDAILIIDLDSNPTSQLLRFMDRRIHSLDSILQRLSLFRQCKEMVGIRPVPSTAIIASNEVFVVHGQDNAAKEEVARFIEKLGLRATILHEQTNKGRTIIEKFEQHAQVGFAVILLTPDDVGHANLPSAAPRPRARQNVVFELGFFIGKLGRSRVCALLKDDIEFPTDISGVLYTRMDTGGAWRLQLAKEIKDAGIAVDLNNAF